MDNTQITLIQDSFKSVVPIADQAAEIFYAELFKIAPEVQPLFKGDMTEQGKKLMTTLGVVVNGLRDMDKILPVAGDLAKRHVDYGVTAEHYTPVGAALLHTLKTGLGDAFTADVEAAWTEAYGALSGAMIAAAYGTPEGAE